MIIEAPVWVWTKDGMVRSSNAEGGYIALRDVESLLEKVHSDAYEAGVERGRDIEKSLSMT